MDARTRFAEIAALPDEEIDLAEAALVLAAEAVPELDVAAYLARIDELARELAGGNTGESSLRARVDSLNRELFEARGFHGSRDGYYDPRNSFLNEVLDRRTGIPISLCVLYVELARRLGLHAEGISFPGHFLAKIVDGQEEIVVDAFEARVISDDECAVRLKLALGPRAELREALRAASRKEILVRMLANLKAIYTNESDWEAALGCCDRTAPPVRHPAWRRPRFRQ